MSMQYTETWHYFFDQKKGKAFRVRPDDPRGTNLWCAKGAQIDINYEQDALPIAPAISSDEKRRLEEAHRAIWCRS